MADEQPNGLKFDRMTVDRENYGPNKGKLKAVVKCTQWNTVLDVTLPDDVTNDIMLMIVPVIAAQVKKALLEVQRDHELLMLAHEAPVDGELSGEA